MRGCHARTTEHGNNIPRTYSPTLRQARKRTYSGGPYRHNMVVLHRTKSIAHLEQGTSHQRLDKRTTTLFPHFPGHRVGPWVTMALELQAA
jgi:hypothetical protein